MAPKSATAPKSAAAGELTILCFRDPAQLFRPCVDCGVRTGSFCETMAQVGQAEWQGGVCLAAHQMPTQDWAKDQRTPFCSSCEKQHGACHYCREVQDGKDKKQG
jgi:hypothetical protein